MPFSPDLSGSEHTTGATLVTECSLTSTVRSSSRDTGNTSDSAACRMPLYQFIFSRAQSHSKIVPPPKLSVFQFYIPVPQDSAEVCSPAFSLTAYGCLLFLAIPVCTDLISSSVSRPFNQFPQYFGSLLNNVGTDWRRENSGQRVSGTAGLALGIGDGDGWARCHFVDRLLVVVWR